MQWSFSIFKATLYSPICWRASATAFHVLSLAFRSHRLNISCLQRSPWKFLSILLSSWSSSPNFTPRECQSTTESSAFERSFRVGVAGAVGEEITNYDIFHAHFQGRADTKLTFRQRLSRIRSFRHLSVLFVVLARPTVHFVLARRALECARSSIDYVTLRSLDDLWMCQHPMWPCDGVPRPRVKYSIISWNLNSCIFCYSWKYARTICESIYISQSCWPC